MENRKIANPRAFWIDVLTAAIANTSDERLQLGANKISRVGSKFFLEIEHTETTEDVFHFRHGAYVETSPDTLDSRRFPLGPGTFTIN